MVITEAASAMRDRLTAMDPTVSRDGAAQFGWLFALAHGRHPATTAGPARR